MPMTSIEFITYIFWPLPYNFCRYSCHECKRWNIFCDNSASSYYSSLTNSDIVHDNGTRTYPRSILYNYRTKMLWHTSKLRVTIIML